MTAYLVAFLNARLDEAEMWAREATYCQEDADSDVTEWHVEGTGGSAEVRGSDGLGIIQARTQHPGMLEHIARWDPAHVLADVAAKRRIVEDYQRWLESRRPLPFCTCGHGRAVHPEDGVCVDSRCDCCDFELDDEPLIMADLPAESLMLGHWVRLLAMAYATHPDFDPSWRL